MREGPECEVERLNQPVAPSRRRPSNATLVVTRPLGATIGPGEDSCAESSGVNKTRVRTEPKTQAVLDAGMLMYRLSKVAKVADVATP